MITSLALFFYISRVRYPESTKEQDVQPQVVHLPHCALLGLTAPYWVLLCPTNAAKVLCDVKVLHEDVRPTQDV